MGRVRVIAHVSYLLNTYLSRTRTYISGGIRVMRVPTYFFNIHGYSHVPTSI